MAQTSTLGSWGTAARASSGPVNPNGPTISNGGNTSNTSSSTNSSNGFNYMLMHPDDCSLDDFEGAASDKTSSAAAAMHTTSSILGESIFK